jgi:predicted outer membrane repeat protein
VEIVGSTIAQSAGGGLTVDHSRVAIDGTTIENNMGGGFGTGIFIIESRLTITNSAIRGNSASSGAGLWVYRSRVVVSGTTFSGNTAVGNGGAASVFPGQPALLRLTNCTVSGNQADSGGAFYAGGRGRLFLSSSTVSGNTAVTGVGGIESSGGLPLVIANSILANNVGPGANDCEGPLANRAYNLIEDPSGCDLVGAGVGDIYGVDPLLGPLAANGGPTETHALLAGSPAIATTPDRHCPLTDQRGNPRPVPCDIGAYQTP